MWVVDALQQRILPFSFQAAETIAYLKLIYTYLVYVSRVLAVPVANINPQEEIEILDSDSETLDGGDESGSKEVPASIGDGGKRKRATCGGDQLNPEALRPRRESTPPQSTKGYRGNIGRFQQRQPENNGRLQEQETTSPNPGDIERKRDADVHGSGTNKSSTPDSKSPPSKLAPVAKAAATEVMITEHSFDLRENVTRREEFQAGVKAILRDDDPICSSHDTGKAGDGRGGVGVDEGSRGGRGEAEDVKAARTHKKAFAGRSNGTSSKGKGKGASGGVKLTPMEQQVCDLKAKHPGVLLLVECGYRFRFFGEDALAAAKVEWGRVESIFIFSYYAKAVTRQNSGSA